MITEEELIKKLKLLDTQNVLDFDLINKAIYWAKKYHSEQKRKSGEPYYTHPLEVAYMISDYNLKTDVIVASILHDIIEDTEVTAGMILDNFGWRIAEMVDRLTRDRPDGSKLSVEEIINNIINQITNQKINIYYEALLIKIFDRLHNTQDVKHIGYPTCFQYYKDMDLFFSSIKHFGSAIKYNKLVQLLNEAKLRLENKLEQREE